MFLLSLNLYTTLTLTPSSSSSSAAAGMKLKQRVILGLVFGLTAVALCLLTLSGLLPSAKHHMPTDLRRLFVPQHKPEDRSINVADDPKAMNQVHDDLRGHLHVIRKDLDVSNYSSNHNRSPELLNINNNNLNVPINLPDAQLADYIQNHKHLADNADSVIRLAHALERYAHGEVIGGGGGGPQVKEDRLIPRNMTKEFVPDKGDVVMPGGLYRDLDVKFPWEWRRLPAKVELTQSVDTRAPICKN